MRCVRGEIRMTYWRDWVVISKIGKPFIDVSLPGKVKFGSVRFEIPFRQEERQVVSSGELLRPGT